MVMKFCPFCGVKLQDNMIFCPNCGRKFQGIIQIPSSSDKILPENTLGNSASNVTTNQHKGTKLNRISLFLFSTILCITIIVFGWLYYNGKTDKKIDISQIANSILYLEIYDNNNELTSTASGIIAGDSNTLITNFHVISGAYKIIAWSADGKHSIEIDELLAYDATSDLAVLRLDENIEIPPLSIGNPDQLKPGDSIYAVGYPLGLANTISDGVISSKYIDDTGVEILQTTAAISQGSSGGALLNLDGEVVGVICASYVDGQNINLAISFDEVNQLLKSTFSPILLSDFYNFYYLPSISRANLYGNGILTENHEYVFFIDETVSEKNPAVTGPSLVNILDTKIWQYTKKDGSLKSFSARASSLNIFGNKLYYYDMDLHDVCFCEIGEKFGENITPTGLIQPGKSFNNMFFLYGNLILQTSKSSDYTISVLNPLTKEEIVSFPDYYNMTYLDKTIYMVSESSFCSYNLLSNEINEYAVPTQLYRLAPLENGKIYCAENTSINWMEVYGHTIYVFDTHTGTFEPLLTSGVSEMLLCKNDTVLLYEHSGESSTLYDITDGKMTLFPNQNADLSATFMESFVIEDFVNIPQLNWTTESIFGLYHPNNNSICIAQK